MRLIDLANPSRFIALVERILPWLIGLTIIVFAIGLYRAALAPDDYQQGATVKIMFIHVPNAWLASTGSSKPGSTAKSSAPRACADL